MKNVAVLIDGGFLSKIFKKETNRHLIANDVIKIAQKTITTAKEELFRIYYYDAPPFNGKITNPLNKITIDYSGTAVYTAATSFHRELAEKDFIAFRKGKLSFCGWKLTRSAIIKMNRGKLTNIQAHDITPDFKQKAVDMKIGLDIAWLATRKIVNKVILVTADNDFIPPMKFARKEGIHVAVAKIENLNSDMRQHADEIIELNLKNINKGNLEK